MEQQLTPNQQRALRGEQAFAESSRPIREKKRKGEYQRKPLDELLGAPKADTPVAVPTAPQVAAPNSAPVPVPTTPTPVFKGYERLASAVCDIPGFAASPSEGAYLKATYRVDNRYGVIKRLLELPDSMPWPELYAHYRVFVRYIESNIPELTGLDFTTDAGFEALHIFSDDVFEWVCNAGYSAAKDNALGPFFSKG
jgi:hypothetical protein